MYLNLDRAEPDRMALIDDHGSQLSYQALQQLMNEPLPLPKRSLVFVLTQNRTTCVSQILRLIHQDHVPLLLSADLDESLLAHLKQTYRPSAYLLPDSLVPASAAVLEESPGYRLIDTGNPPPPLYPQLELLLSTSGSTGSPKLVRFAKGNMEANAANVTQAFGWTHQDRPLASLPINYVMGLNVLLAHLIAGATCLLTDANLMEKEFWNFARDQRATNFTGVPISYEILLRLKPQRLNVPELTTFAQGGGKLSETTYRRMAALAKDSGWRFIPTYGTTETCARCALLPPELASEKILSIGRAIPNVRLSLIDLSGQTITTPDTEGELVVEGNNVSLGYATSQADLLRGDDFKGRYQTGDVAVFDADGFFYIKGRTKRFIKLLGNRIGLDECERILLEECQAKVICIGREDELTILTDSSDGHDELQKTLARKLKLHHRLFRVRQYRELPLSPGGKILYHQLEKEFLE
ncbi:MAG TPA: AMP-binding protein [Tissierellia bacterium]|nr:AMP-binding protein [Tissierellia bacterium]